LASLQQGEKMSPDNFDNNLIDSVLSVRASEILDSEVLKDLDLPTGQSISCLLNEQKTQQDTKEENPQIKDS
jgi:hypothetical protein